MNVITGVDAWFGADRVRPLTVTAEKVVLSDPKVHITVSLDDQEGRNVVVVQEKDRLLNRGGYVVRKLEERGADAFIRPHTWL